eukprot:scaffold40907_cov41-Phaeocystis_antarctica.AAC.1
MSGTGCITLSGTSCITLPLGSSPSPPPFGLAPLRDPAMAALPCSARKSWTRSAPFRPTTDDQAPSGSTPAFYVFS